MLATVVAALAVVPASAAADAGRNRVVLGSYVGNANGNEPAAMRSFKQSYDQNVAAMGGARPRYFNVFTDFGQPPETWAKSASWAAWSSKQSGDAYIGPGSGSIPLVGVPLASNTLGWGKVDAFYQDVIAGRYDDVYAGIVDAYADNGYKTIDFRIAYEFNGNFMPWAPGNSKAPNARADFVAAFRHVADILHRQGKAKHVQALVHWNPAAINDTSYDVASLYPGDAYVDVIAVDLYNTMYPLTLADWTKGGKGDATDRQSWAASLDNRTHYWRYPNASRRTPTPKLGNWGWSIAQTIDMAKLHGKPMGVDETGTGTAHGALALNDDPEFPRFLARVLGEARDKGVTVHNVNIWDITVGDGAWQFRGGRQPKAAAAWAACFGGASRDPSRRTC
ncbi:glycosyl hydrolase [Glacieibacterium sp.]|uniref:glycosyl hydrolase n=1 Tax=Glacieibacterium sp. TaxID=2860237 RepID=UPI003B00EC6B